jgi:hypothetical protein
MKPPLKLAGSHARRLRRCVRANESERPRASDQFRRADGDEHDASRDEDERRRPDRQPYSDRKHAPDEPAPGNAHIPTIAFVGLAEWSSSPVSRHVRSRRVTGVTRPCADYMSVDGLGRGSDTSGPSPLADLMSETLVGSAKRLTRPVRPGSRGGMDCWARGTRSDPSSTVRDETAQSRSPAFRSLLARPIPYIRCFAQLR